MENPNEFLQYYPGFISSQLIGDGIINPEIFSIQNPKILFICKEHNQLLDELKNADYKIWWNQGLKYSFSRRIAEWSFGLLNNFEAFDKITDYDRLKSLQSIAFINVKKIAAGSKADHDELNELIIKSKNSLLNQIRSINPDLIICSLGQWKLIHSLFDVDWEDFKSVEGMNGSFDWEGIKIIGFRHPSNRKKLADSYELLKKIAGDMNWNK